MLFVTLLFCGNPESAKSDKADSRMCCETQRTKCPSLPLFAIAKLLIHWKTFKTIPFDRRACNARTLNHRTQASGFPAHKPETCAASGKMEACLR
jgi:hypothetical protein